MSDPRREPLIQSPTPVHRLDKMSAELGVDLWVKRDDLTGFALGGNKGRKLEYLIAAALDSGAEAVVSCGSTQSNFVRQLGGACARFGLKCGAAVMDKPYDGPAGKPPDLHLPNDGGNLLADEILGVDVHRFPDGTWEELYDHAEAVAAAYEAEGLRVYRIPIGGSSPLGAYGFFKAAEELDAQTGAFDQIVVSSSSGSTHSGLTYAYHGRPTRVIGISADPEPGLTEEFAELCAGLDTLIGQNRQVRPEDFDLRLDWVGLGYAVPSEEGNAAIVRMARAEGIFLDPVYSGKAFAGLIDLAARGELPGRTMFWHTGGSPSLFAVRRLAELSTGLGPVGSAQAAVHPAR